MMISETLCEMSTWSLDADAVGGAINARIDLDYLARWQPEEKL